MAGETAQAPPSAGLPLDSARFYDGGMFFRLARWWVGGCLFLVGVIGASVGCRPQRTPEGERTAPMPQAPALYGAAVGEDVRTPSAVATTNLAWPSANFYIVQSGLSPATLVHSSAKYLGLFTGMTNDGLGAPAFVAWSTPSGPRAFKSGTPLDPNPMEENWLLVWWAGAQGWTNWDSPWVIYLQHRPEFLKLDANGLHLDFPQAAGDVVLMPLYGYEKMPAKDFNYLTTHGLPGRKPKVQTWEWAEAIARDPLTRIRYWAGVTRELPIHCEETFSVNRAEDSVTIRSRFAWHSIVDDWHTHPIKLAPISPTLGLVAKEGGFPVKFSQRWFDHELPTPFGPYLAIESVDSYDATLSVLQYVNETEVTETPKHLAHPGVAPTFETLLAYGHHSGDWTLVKERWPLLLKTFTETTRTGWAGFGRDGIAALGDGAAHAAAFARMAYKVGDMTSYHDGCHRFVRELVLHCAKQRGAEYFRRRQPWHSLEFMDDEVFLTQLGGATGGWQFDGPKFPAQATERLFEQRWARFQDADVARYYREYLRDDVRREINWRQSRTTNSSSLLPLRALLVKEPPDERVRYQRLIPGGAASPFLTGPVPAASALDATLITAIQLGQTTNTWPRLTWPEWKTPTGAPWTFGTIRPVRKGEPRRVETTVLNAQARAISCTWP